ncbi:MAG: hypothetical protein HKN47_16655 [Pirellulaceae bacterium]|nr:hypothetical protein [Pirellulaceae bacterium]
MIVIRREVTMDSFLDVVGKNDVLVHEENALCRSSFLQVTVLSADKEFIRSEKLSVEVVRRALARQSLS